MKGLISGIKRMEIHDGDGLRTTVFFKGCPLRCLWCHNPESLSFEKQIAFFKGKCVFCGTCKGERSECTAARCPVDALWVYGKEYGLDELTDTVCVDATFFKNGGGVTLSGGECLAQPEFAVAFAKKLYDRGISVYVDTCGYVRHEILEAIMPYTDKFLYDIKAINAETHKRCTGRDNGVILENLRYLCRQGARIEVRYPLVMGYNDLEIEGIAKFLKEAGGVEAVKVLQYHAFSASRYEALGMENTLPHTETSAEDVENAVRILKENGLRALNGAVDD